jgi:enoyl-CoA hydratase/carnithine racemase
VNEATEAVPMRLVRVSPTTSRVIFDNPPLKLIGPEFVLQFREIMAALEADERIKVVIFESAKASF